MLENRQCADDDKMQTLEQVLKATEEAASEAERKFEEVCCACMLEGTGKVLFITHGDWWYSLLFQVTAPAHRCITASLTGDDFYIDTFRMALSQETHFSFFFSVLYRFNKFTSLFIFRFSLFAQLFTFNFALHVITDKSPETLQRGPGRGI